MPFLVGNNVFTAQSATTLGVNDGSVGMPNSGFGHSTEYMTNIDRIFMSPIDGAEGYTNSVWVYDIDNRVWTRQRPNQTGPNAAGAFRQASVNDLHDFFGPAWGDNQQIVYNPDAGTVWRWGGNAGDNANAAGAIDPTWFNHYNTVDPNGGAYIYDPVGDAWTMPKLTGYGGASSGNRYLSAGCGWDPNIRKFLQVCGAGANGLSTADSYVVEIDPLTNPPGGTHTRFNFTGTASQVVDSTTFGPLGRAEIAYQFVYHSKARKWILFGGIETYYTSFRSDTWMYDAVTRKWTNLMPRGTPPARAFGLMWYDSLNDVILITGGQSAGVVNRTDTWEYSLAQNRWKQHAATFNRGAASGAAASNSGGAVFLENRNIAVITPCTGSGADRDVYTFRYAKTRVSITTGQWYGYRRPTGGIGIDGSDKHLRPAYCPLDGKIYFHGGDFVGQGPDDGAFNAGSYNQRLFSINLVTRFASPTNRDAGAAQEYGWNSTGAAVQPKRPDYISLQWDDWAQKMLMAGGLFVPGYAGAITLDAAIGGGELTFTITNPSREIVPGVSGNSTLVFPFTARITGPGFDGISTPSEDITVSNIVLVSGSQYTVTATSRVVVGTTPVAHAIGSQFSGVGDGYPAGGTPTNGTYAKADDPNYLHRHFMYWDPATSAWEDFAFNPNSPSSNAWWQTWRDPILDILWRFVDIGGNFVVQQFDMTAKTWTQFTHALAFNIDIHSTSWVVDPYSRVAYFADREFGKLYTYKLGATISTGTFTVVGNLPAVASGTPVWDGSRVPSDKGYLLFDWFSRMLAYDARESNGGGSIKDTIWVYNPDAASPVWVQLTAAGPTTGIGGESIPAGDRTPHATGMTYDWDNHVWHLYGTQTGTSNEYGYAH